MGVAKFSDYNLFKVPPEETVGHFIYDLGEKQYKDATVQKKTRGFIDTEIYMVDKINLVQ
ncbi:MAG: hypothetical protein ACQES8_03980 [Thermodesulfobacteriota bacterium]